MIRKTQRGLSSTASSSSDALEPSKLPSAVLRLGARIVRELELEPSVDTLGRWMAHHLAEVMQEVESAEGSDKEQAPRARRLMEVGPAIAPSSIPREQVGRVGLDDLEQLAQLRFQFIDPLLGLTKR